MPLLRRLRLSDLWKDSRGFVVNSELILLATVLVIGMVTGLTSIRDQVAQELGDVATAIGSLNQSYSFGAITLDGASVAGSVFSDARDFCDTPIFSDDDPPLNNNPVFIVCVVIGGEN